MSKPMFRLAAAAVAALLALVVGGRALLADEARSEVVQSAEQGIGGVATELAKATAGSREAAQTPAWVERGNAICRAEEVELDTLAQPRTMDELVPYLRRAIRIADHYEPQFSRLRVPAGKRDELARVTRTSREGRVLLRRMLAAAQRKDSTGVLAAAQDAIALARRANPLMRKLGLGDCALSQSGFAL